MRVPARELDFSFSRSSGAGGQNINKVNTKVTMTWKIDSSSSVSQAVKNRFKSTYARLILIDGRVQIMSQRFRSQPRNIADCIEKLTSMLENVSKAPKKRLKTKPSQSSIKREIQKQKNKAKTKQNRQKVKY